MDSTLQQIKKGELPTLTRENLAQTAVGALIPKTLEEALSVAQALHVSRLFPDIQNAQQAFVKIMAGAEWGLPPIASLNAFHIVKGKIMAHYSSIAGRIRSAGYDYRATVHTDDECEIAFYGRGGDEIGRFCFTREDAKRAGTQNMDKMPRTMLFARAIAQGARFFVPEAFNGMIVYAHEERDSILADYPEEPTEEDPTFGTSDRLTARIASTETPDEYDPFDAMNDDEPTGSLIE